MEDLSIQMETVRNFAQRMDHHIYKVQQLEKEVDEIEAKILELIKECKHQRKELRNQAKLQGKTERISVDEDNENQKLAIDLYKRGAQIKFLPNNSSINFCFTNY